MDNPSNTVAAASGTRPSAAPPAPRRTSRVVLMVLGFLVLSCGVVAATTAWWVKRNVYASPMKPVMLSANEQKVLDAKLQAIQGPAATAVTPEEQARTLTITQKEINAYLAAQNLGETVRVELGDGRISATMIVPIPADAGVPLVSGTTLRVMLTMATAMDANKKLSIKLNDVRVGGISLPNAWLGDLKGVNLVAENIEQDPGLQRFLAGIQEMEVRPDGLRVLLNE